MVGGIFGNTTGGIAPVVSACRASICVSTYCPAWAQCLRTQTSFLMSRVIQIKMTAPKIATRMLQINPPAPKPSRLTTHPPTMPPTGFRILGGVVDGYNPVVQVALSEFCGSFGD